MQYKYIYHLINLRYFDHTGVQDGDRLCLKRLRVLVIGLRERKKFTSNTSVEFCQLAIIQIWLPRKSYLYSDA